MKHIGSGFLLRFLLDETLRSGRPVEVDGDQIETVTDSSQHYTVQEIACIKIPKSSIDSHLHKFGYFNHFDI